MAKTKEIQACIRCQHLPNEKDKYCTHCGAPLKNTCTNKGGLLGEPCKQINHPRAAFCSACGAHTSFYKAGLVTSPYPENPLVHQEEEFEEMRDISHFFFND